MTSAGSASLKPKRCMKCSLTISSHYVPSLRAAFSQELCLNFYLTINVANDAVCRGLIQRCFPIARGRAREFGFSMKIRNCGQEKLINKPVFLAISMQQFFQKALVREGREIVLRAQLEKYRHRYPPGHPLARVIFQVPTAAQKTFHH